MSITPVAAVLPAYPPSYPSGVVLVSSKRHLAPLVERLRRAGRLKPGRNVTSFDAARYAALADAPASDGAMNAEAGRRSAQVLPRALVESCLTLREVTEEEADNLGLDAPGGLPAEAFTLTTSSAHSHAVQLLLSLLRTPFAARDGASWPSYTAVHVAGDLSRRDLAELLAPPCGGDATRETAGATPADARASAGEEEGEEGAAPVAYIRGVRRFHRVCCPDLADMPSALAALRRCALTQRYRRAPAAPAAPAARPQPPREGKGRITFSELFAGIGMFRTALEGVGGRAAFAVEFAPPAQITYALNHRCWHDCPPVLQLPNAKPQRAEDAALHDTHAASLLVSDITEIPSVCFPAHDVLTGGFPCQSFAKAGEAAGLYADKGWLFYEVVRVLAATRPAAFLLENVENLTAVEAGLQLAEILARLRHPTLGAMHTEAWQQHASTPDSRSSTRHAAETGGAHEEEGALEYAVQYVVLDGAALTPQTRKRVYFVGIKAAATQQSSGHEAGTGCTAAMADVARVIADALRNVDAAAQESRYRTVADLLVVPATSDAAASARLNSSVNCDGASNASLFSARTPTDLQLTSAQWDAVQRSRTFRQNPRWRLCDLHGRARTLLGSYRTSYQLYSEFVPYAPTRTAAEVTATLLEAAPTTTDPGDDDEAGASAQPTSLSSPRPPLRFFALRECARLQGIDDGFRLPHDATPLPATSSAAAAAAAATISPAVLRQVPPGAVYKLIGNAVNPRVVACLGAAVVAYLERQRGIGNVQGGAAAGG